MGRYKTHPRRDYQRGRILALIANEALTAKQLSERLHLCKDGITKRHLNPMRLETPKLVYIESHDHSIRGGRPAPKYRAGDKPDAVYVHTRAAYRHTLLDQRRKAIKQSLKSKPKTTRALCEEMGMSDTYIRWFIAELRTTNPKQAYIKDWDERPTGYAPIYAIGNLPDAPRKKLDAKARYARLKKRQEQDDSAKDRHNLKRARRQINASIKRTKAKPNTWAGALGL